MCVFLTLDIDYYVLLKLLPRFFSLGLVSGRPATLPDQHITLVHQTCSVF